MNYYKIFFKKEIIELWRTKRTMIVIIVSFFFGISSVMLTKMMPEILKSQSTDTLQFIVKDPDKYDCWTQFFKNINQLGAVAIIIVFSDIVAKELQSGTLVNVITKGVSRTSIICSVYSVAILLWTFLVASSTIICQLYSIYYWGAVNSKKLLFAIFMSWLFGTFLLSFLILGQVWGKSFFGGLIFTGVAYAASLIMGMVPKVKSYTPSNLSNGVQVIIGTGDYSDYYKAIIVSSLIIVAVVAVTIKKFDKICL